MAVATVVGFGGAMSALWAATGAVLNAGAVLGDTLGNTAQALNNLSLVAVETSDIYLLESRATRKSKQLELERKFAAEVAAGGAPALGTAPAFALN